MIGLFLLILGYQIQVAPFLPLSGDTLELGVVEVYAPPLQKYAHGQWVRTLDQDQLEGLQGLDLGSALQQKSGLFVRQYGPGMLASLTMRGSSSGHNALYWNGLPVNSPSLGQADFSIFPIGGSDEISIHYGSSGALYGTDAIGGSIHLSNKLNFNEGSQWSIGTLVGSFGRWNQMGEYRYSGKVFSSRTKVYRNHAENDFPFADLSLSGTPKKYQSHAQVSQVGLMQDIGWVLDDKQQISTSFWLNHTDRQIQPVMGSKGQDLQFDRNLRWVLDYFRFRDRITWNLKAGLVGDHLDFNQEKNQTLQFLLSGDLDWKLSKKWQTKAGLRYTLVKGLLSTYSHDEERWEGYYAVNFKPRESMGFSFQWRQLVFGGRWAPITPSLGGDWEFFKTPHHKGVLNGNISRSYKVPTLNDRFWVPGGNPDLLPEKSWSGELGLKYRYQKGPFRAEGRLAYYKMLVDQWILWLPQEGYWAPENIRKVANSGLEVFVDTNWKPGKWHFSGKVDYAFSEAINQSGDQGNSRSIGKQLPYTPLHKAQTTLSMGKGSITGFIAALFVGERFTATDNTGVLPAYRLYDVGIKRSISIYKINGNMGFQINNLLNTDYQVIRLRAMPGRNYQINIQFTL
ncbi:MAG: TonB-dependent receptor [Cyclobacteriaceae bacterium]